MSGESLLTIAVLLPAAVGLLAVALGLRWRAEAWLGLFGMAAEAVVAMLLLRTVIDAGDVSLLIASTSALGVEFSLRFVVDDLSAFFVLLVALVGFVCALPALDAAAASPFSRYQPVVALLLTSAFAAVFFSGNLLTLYVFWQLAIICFALALAAGFRRGAVSAAAKFLVMNEVGALLLLFAVSLTYSRGPDSSLVAWLTVGDPWMQTVVGVCLVAAALTAVAAVPLHTWFADAGETVEPSLMPFILGVHGKLGLYLLARLSLAGVVDGTMSGWAPALLVFATLTVVLASVNALARRDNRRLLALVAVAQIGFVLLGLASGERLGILGALFYLAVQSLALPLLALSLALVGGSLRSYQAARPAMEPGRLLIALLGFSVGALSLVGLPPLAGAVGQTLIYQGLVERDEAWRGLVIVAGILASVLTAAALLRIAGRSFVGEERVRLPYLSLATGPAEAGVVLLTGLCLVLGFLPGLLLDPMLASLAGLSASGAWGELAFGEGDLIWNPTLTAVLVALPLALWSLVSLGRSALRRSAPVSEAEAARELAEPSSSHDVPKLALALSPQDELGSTGPVDAMFALGWWRWLLDWTSSRSLDLYQLVSRIVLPLSRLVAHVLRLTFRLLLH